MYYLQQSSYDLVSGNDNKIVPDEDFHPEEEVRQEYGEKVQVDAAHIKHLKADMRRRNELNKANKARWARNHIITGSEGIFALDTQPPPTQKELIRQAKRNGRKYRIQKSTWGLLGKPKVTIVNKHFHTKKSKVTKEYVIAQIEEEASRAGNFLKLPLLPNQAKRLNEGAQTHRGRLQGNGDDEVKPRRPEHCNISGRVLRKQAINRIIARHKHPLAESICTCHTKNQFGSYSKSNQAYGHWLMNKYPKAHVHEKACSLLAPITAVVAVVEE